MRKACILFLVLIISVLSAYGQKNGSVRGLIYDTLSRQPVTSATITVLEKKDSSLVTFTMSDHQGKFELKGLPNGEYRLLVSHISYHNEQVDDRNTDYIPNRPKDKINTKQWLWQKENIRYATLRIWIPPGGFAGFIVIFVDLVSLYDRFLAIATIIKMTVHYNGSK